jgi:hypothetical protein
MEWNGPPPCTTQVSVVQYSSYTVGSGSHEKRIGMLEVKSKAWDEHLGGFRFDLRYLLKTSS